MSKLELFREIYRLHQLKTEWIESVPSDIRDSYFENTYVECLQKQIDLLMNEVFSKEEREDIDWFLYEWDDNHDLEVILNGVTYTIKNIDNYIEFLIKCGWE